MDKIKYLNNIISNNIVNYNGPKTLFKYRPFDEFAFDMFENDYVFLCPAEKEDDKTECNVSFDINDYYNLQSDRLKVMCIDFILDKIKPFTSDESFRQVRELLFQSVADDGTVSRRILLDMSLWCQDLIPDNCHVDMVNWLGNIPERLNDPEIKLQIEKLLIMGANAKKQMGICSLCESKDVSEMWKEYAANGSGYCIEYDISHYEYNKSIFPVIYQDDRDTNILTQIMGNFIGQMIFGISNGQADVDQSQFLRLFLTKDKEWEYQNEWRILGDAGSKLSAPKIKAVYLGRNCSKSNRFKMQEIARIKSFKLHN